MYAFLTLSSFMLQKAHCIRPAIHSFPTRRSSDLRKVRDAQLWATPIPTYGTYLLAAVEEMTLRSNRRGKRLALEGISAEDRKSTRLNSSHVAISYAVFCLKKKTMK